MNRVFLSFLCVFFVVYALVASACSIKTTTHTFSENTYWLEANIEYPSFSSCDVCNAAIAHYVLSGYQQFKIEQETSWNSIAATNAEYGTSYENQQFGYLVNAEKMSIGKRYVNVLMNTWTFTGGAHGNSTFKSFVYDRISKSLVTAPTSFGISYKEISQKCRAYLDEQLPKYEATEEYLMRRKTWINAGTEPNAQNFETFTYDGKTLTIYFDAYQVAPYSEGAQAVPIELQ